MGIGAMPVNEKNLNPEIETIISAVCQPGRRATVNEKNLNPEIETPEHRTCHARPLQRL